MGLNLSLPTLGKLLADVLSKLLANRQLGAIANEARDCRAGIVPAPSLP